MSSQWYLECCQLQKHWYSSNVHWLFLHTPLSDLGPSVQCLLPNKKAICIIYYSNFGCAKIELMLNACILLTERGNCAHPMVKIRSNQCMYVGLHMYTEFEITWNYHENVHESLLMHRLIHLIFWCICIFAHFDKCKDLVGIFMQALVGLHEAPALCSLLIWYNCAVFTTSFGLMVLGVRRTCHSTAYIFKKTSMGFSRNKLL